MAALLHAEEGVLGGVGHAGLLHHEVAAHVDNGVDVLDEDGARLHAGAAGGAGPEDVLGHGVDHRGLGGRRLLAGGGREEGGGALLGVEPEVLDELARGEGLAAGVGGALVLAPAAVGAGVEVEDLLPGEVGDLGGAEAFEGLDVAHGAEGAEGAVGAEEGVHGADEDVGELAEADGNVDEAGGVDEDVEPVDGEVGHFAGGGGEAEAPEGQCGEVADGLPGGDAGIVEGALGVQGRGGDAETLDEEAGDGEGGEEAEDDGVVDEGVEARGPEDVASEDGHEEACGEEAAAEDVPEETGVGAGVGGGELEAESWSNVAVPVELEGGHGGGDEQPEHAPEQEEVHEAGVELALEEAAMAEDVEEGEPGGAVEAAPPGAEVGHGFTEAVDAVALVGAVRDGGCGDEDGEVDQCAEEGVADVPELEAAGEIGHDGTWRDRIGTARTVAGAGRRSRSPVG